MDENETTNLNPNLKCKVCGESAFNLCEGFYYCEECGTKQDQVRAIEVDREHEFNDSKHVKKLKIHKLKTEKPQLTSWECYNYILRGLVEELLSFGAKEELKLMTLQLWAAYLRNSEVAFFNKKHAELPKLGLRFFKRDVRTLYNHIEEKRVKKRKRTDEASLVSGESSAREWRKKKRKLDESEYSLHSANQSFTSNDLSFSQSSMNTSSTGTTGRAIQLKFSRVARRRLKKVMPPKHIKKHELDGEGSLHCHKLRGNRETSRRRDLAIDTLNMRQIYTILGIALNYVEDDIQVSDLVRFIAEGHIGTKNVLQYFPENVVQNSHELLKEIDYYLNQDKCSDKALRDQIALMAQFLRLNQFKKPDIFKLCLRYITDLNLPKDISNYVERLINILPPQMQMRVSHMYPAFEARAMAYLVFVLKLLFGLDGHKERRISESAKNVNTVIQQFNEEEDTNQHPLLFVWSDWVEYIEMRKVVVSQYNSTFCRQFKQCQSTPQLLEQLRAEQQQKTEQDALAMDDAKTTNGKISSMQTIFENFQQNNATTGTFKDVESMSFTPSFTPAHSYFKRILLHCSMADNPSVNIPEFMRLDHTQRTLQPYVMSRELSEFLSQHNCSLNVELAACTENRKYAGVFRAATEHVTSELRTQKADFNISEHEWLKSFEAEWVMDELEFKTELDSYEKQYMKHLQALAMKRRQHEHVLNGVDSEKAANNKQSEQPESFDVLSMHSIDVFKEYGMEPLENLQLKGPRRQLGCVNLFENLDDGDVVPEVNSKTESSPKVSTTTQESVTLLRSNMDCWTLLGSIYSLKEVHKKVLENKFPNSFFWLLETCAQTIGVDWSALYEQVLTLELMFGYGIENLDSFKDCLRYKYNNPIKDINVLINLHREIW